MQELDRLFWPTSLPPVSEVLQAELVGGGSLMDSLPRGLCGCYRGVAPPHTACEVAGTLSIDSCLGACRVVHSQAALLGQACTHPRRSQKKPCTTTLRCYLHKIHWRPARLRGPRHAHAEHPGTADIPIRPSRNLRHPEKGMDDCVLACDSQRFCAPCAVSSVRLVGRMHPNIKPAPLRAAASRKWLQVDAQGKLAYVNVDKHTLVLRLNIPYRDLRSLESTVRRSLPAQHFSCSRLGACTDPAAPVQVANAYQAGILVREKAFVVNLEAVKMIVTQDQARVALSDSEPVRAPGICGKLEYRQAPPKLRQTLPPPLRFRTVYVAP